MRFAPSGVGNTCAPTSSARFPGPAFSGLSGRVSEFSLVRRLFPKSTAQPPWYESGKPVVVSTRERVLEATGYSGEREGALDSDSGAPDVLSLASLVRYSCHAGSGAVLAGGT